MEVINLIDIHCHILPQMDDGPNTMEMCIQMCYQYVKNGYTDIIATPHHLHTSFSNPGNSVKQAVNQLKKELIKRKIPLNIYSGQELRINEELLLKLEQGDALTLANSKFFLIEFPTTFIPLYSLSLLEQLIDLGYKPIIVHPERNTVIMNNPEKLTSFIELGAYSQITWSSLSYNSKYRKVSKELLKKELVHFIATDAHDTHYKPINTSKIKKQIFTPKFKKQIEQLENNSYKILPT